MQSCEIIVLEQILTLVNNLSSATTERNIHHAPKWRNSGSEIITKLLENNLEV